MSQTIVAPAAHVNNPFETMMTVDARFAGGTITADTDHVDWLGETLVKLDIPATSPIALRPHEARDLAAALLALAAFIDEEVAA